MKIQIDPEVTHEMAVERLLEHIEEGLHQFWESHEEACEYEEDMLPRSLRDATDRTIMARAKADLEKKSAAEIAELDGDSRYSYTLRCRTIEHYLGQAGAAVENYFARVAYA